MAQPPTPPTGSNGTKGKHTRRGSSWSPSFPYVTDYNDHFETPRQAYLDVKPLLDWLINSCCLTDIDSDTSCTKTATAALYDPYYCNGRTAVLLRELGYDNVIHEKRDFYADMGTFHKYDILITNPPYSDTHKKRCLAYCLEQLRYDSNNQQQQAISGNSGKVITAAKTTTTRKPFLLLMPAYTASKQYYRDCLNLTSFNDEEDVVYLVPSVPYHYEHPENTGKDQSPFESLWFCGIGKDRVASFQRYWESLPMTNHRPKLATSLAELQKMNVISFQNRPNPRKRGKKRKQMMMAMQLAPAQATTVTSATKGPPTNVLSSSSNPSKIKKGSDMTSTASIPAGLSVPPENEKKSKYRDQAGARSRKRF